MAWIDDMNEIVICKALWPMRYGEMRWLTELKCSCRACYKIPHKIIMSLPYTWDDLDGPVPTMEDYNSKRHPHLQKNGPLCHTCPVRDICKHVGTFKL